MSHDVAALTPRSVWGHFADILQIPRPSKHEEKMIEHVRAVAKKHGFEVRSDAIGNLVVVVPATQGHENAPTVILQGHLDMVCEKNKGTEHDFMNDPIVPRIEGEWLYATGTTLGADNGIGVAAALAMATDPSVTHGPLELLFTLDEETGLTGAQKLDGSMLEGRTMLNLDAEEDGVLYVGCAGGADTHLFLTAGRTPPASGFVPLTLDVKGLRGGHSGLNINENRANALKLLSRILSAAVNEGVTYQLASLHGGSMHNAIPREATAILHVRKDDEDKLRGIVACQLEGFKTEVEGVDDGLEIALAATEPAAEVFEDADRDRLVRLLLALPHGVLAMSAAVPGLVETSNNLAAVSETDGKIKIVASSRSSIMSSIGGVLASIRAAGELAGAEVQTHDGYPGWKPNLASPVLGVAREVYAKEWGRAPEVTAIHAGLECGLLGEKVDGLDMVSFGPQIEGPHSPDERINIPSVERFWNALRGVLEKLATA
jgi:dipeptidase D